MKLKYVMFDNLGVYGTNDGFLIFQEFEPHDSVAKRYGGIDHVLSASFVSIKHDCEQNSFVANCYGRSTSLDIDSREIDSKIITFYLNTQNK